MLSALCFQCRTSAALKKWVIITPKRDSGNAEELKKSLEKVFSGLGMEVNSPKMVVIEDSKVRIQLIVAYLKHQ